jgi:hypothetical protein
MVALSGFVYWIYPGHIVRRRWQNVDKHSNMRFAHCLFLIEARGSIRHSRSILAAMNLGGCFLGKAWMRAVAAEGIQHGSANLWFVQIDALGHFGLYYAKCVSERVGT